MRMVKWGLFLGLGFYLCGVLTVIPIPQEYQWYRPQWLLMLVIFCQINQPTAFNPLIAWVGGLLLDSLLGTRLGEHAFVFAIICYLTALLRPRFIMRPLWQQIGKIFLLVCLGQIFILWFHVFNGQNPHTLLYWMGSVISCLIWPVFVLFFQYLCRFFNLTALSSRNI